MARGDKSSYTQKRKAVYSSYEKISDEEADRRAWAIVNKPDHGDKKSGSGRKRAKHDYNEEQ